MINIKALEEKRNTLVEELRELQKVAEVEVRALTNEELTIFDAKEEEIRSIEKTLEKLEKEFRNNLDVKGVQEMNAEVRANQEKLVNDYIRTGVVTEELRALNGTGTASAGVTIPSTISGDIIKDVKETCGIIEECKTVEFKGTYKQIKRKKSNEVNWVDEFGTIAPSKAEYEGIEFGSFRCSGLDTVSLEIINQGEFNIINEVQENIKEEISNKLEATIFKGTGVKQPTGVITTFDEVVEEELTSDMIVDMIHGVKGKYYANSKFYMNRKTLAKVRKLKDANKQYIFAPSMSGDGLQNGYVGMLLGKPVKITEELEDEIIFGDFKQGYLVKIDPNISIQILNERFADEGAVGIVGHAFVDGKVIDENAFVVKKVQTV